LPSGGALIFLSLVAAVGSVYYGFQIGSTAGLLVLAVDLATVPLLLWGAIKIWPHTPIGKRALLQPTTYSSDDQHQLLYNFVGHVVAVRWPIAPTGQIQIGHQRYNVISSDGQYIDSGHRVKILRVQERLLVVTPTDQPLTTPKLDNSSASQEVSDQQNLLELPAAQIGLSGIDDTKPPN
jgi:membrane-bound ClpP family serine protease